MRALIKREPVEGFEFDENCPIDEPVGGFLKYLFI